jgi:HK97 family phage major capsid protein
MPFDNIISRTDAGALIPEDVAAAVVQGATEQSAGLTLFRRVPMSRKQQRMPVLSALPTAYFVNGDTGLKQTTEANWANKYLDAEELAAIVPVPNNVLDDTDFDIWGETRPLLEEAIGRAVDAAIFFGVNKPASWPTAVVTAAIAAGNVVNRGTNAAAAGGIVGDLSDMFATVETDGYDVNGLIAVTSWKGRLRQARGTTGDRLAEVSANAVDGIDVRYPMRGLWPTGAGAAEVIGGDFSQGIVAVRKDMTFEIFREGVIQDNTGAIIYNLLQQDMSALRVTFRVAWQVPNPIRRDQETEANRYPFGVVRQAP